MHALENHKKIFSLDVSSLISYNHQQKIERKIKKNGNLLAIILTLDFLTLKEKLQNLIISKNWHSILKKQIYKNILFDPNIEFQFNTRLKIWKILLELVKIIKNFFSIFIY